MELQRKILTCVTVVAVILHRTTASVATQNNSKENTTEKICMTKGCVRAAAMLIEAVDQSKNPCFDFYDFACGNWVKTNQLPPGEIKFTAFDEVTASLNGQLKRKRIADGSKPYFDLMKQFGSWPIIDRYWQEKSAPDLEVLLGDIGRELGVQPILSIEITTDPLNSGQYMLLVTNPILEASKSKNLDLEDKSSREKYHQFMKNVVLLLSQDAGIKPLPDLDEQIEQIIQFEKVLRSINQTNGIHPTKQNGTSHDEILNRLSFKSLLKEFGNYNWEKHLEGLLPPSTYNTLSPNDTVWVPAFNYTKEVTKHLALWSKRVVHNHVFWKVTETLLPYMDSRFQELLLEFQASTPDNKGSIELWKTCVEATNNLLGVALGSMYSKTHFSDAIKSTIEGYAKSIQSAYKDLVNSSTWVVQGTKDAINQKLDAMAFIVGQDTHFDEAAELDEGHKDLKLCKDCMLNNVRDIRRWSIRKRYEQFGETARKNRSNGRSAVGNAFYFLYQNMLEIPAGILQQPFFANSNLDALNYGAIGKVIGHEISHGFDGIGQMFDSQGNYGTWWDAGTIEKFKNRSQCFIDQYSSYVVPELGVKADGIQTLKKNIADNVGIRLGYLAYQKNRCRMKLPGWPDFDDNQLFFLALGREQCAFASKEGAKYVLETDVHSHPKHRLNGALRNMIEFSEAFQCKEGTNMNPKKKCYLW